MSAESEAAFNAEPCARCGAPRQAHKLGNYADPPVIGASFLLCPTAVFQDPRVTRPPVSDVQAAEKPVNQ